MTIRTLLAGKRVLLVDDEPDLLAALVSYFKAVGCITLEAVGGEDAIETMRNHSVDVVISDVQMAKGDGLELLRWIRNNYQTVPVVILITGFSRITEEQAILAGAQGLMEKPLDRKKLVALLEKSLS